MKKIMFFVTLSVLTFCSIFAKATIVITLRDPGLYMEDYRGNFYCHFAPNSTCYTVVVIASRASDVTIDGGTTTDGDNYTISVFENFDLYNNFTGNPQITLTVFDGSNSGNGSQYAINSIYQIAGDQDNPALVQYQ